MAALGIWGFGGLGVGGIGSSLGQSFVQTVFFQEALEFGGEAEAGEFVGHPDVGLAVAGVFDAGAEIAVGEDFSGGSANDAGEEIVDFLEVERDDVGAGFLQGFDAGDDAFSAEETAAAGGGDTSARAGLADRDGWAVRV